MTLSTNQKVTKSQTSMITLVTKILTPLPYQPGANLIPFQ